MGYEWPDWALAALNGIEPHEVGQALASSRRRPLSARDDAGVSVLAIWARTDAGRALVVALRQVGRWNWLIVGARDLNSDELKQFEVWEAGQ